MSIVVVSYNTSELTAACLDSINTEMRDAPFEVIVLDNASSDGSAKNIGAQFPQTTLIASDQNLGFAGANNLASRDARGQYILLLNPDTVVLDGAIDRLVHFADKNPEFGIFGGRTIFPDGVLNPTSCWRSPTIWNSFCRAFGLSAAFKSSALFSADAYGGWSRDSVREVDIISGCFLLIRKELWETLGGFDTSYFMYGEDWDLCLRARAHCARCLFCPDAEIIHYGGASEPVRPDKIVRLFQTKAKLYGDHYGPMYGCVLYLMLRLWALRCIITSSLLGFVRGRNRPNAGSEWKEVWRRRKEWPYQGRRKNDDRMGDKT